MKNFLLPLVAILFIASAQAAPGPVIEPPKGITTDPNIRHKPAQQRTDPISRKPSATPRPTFVPNSAVLERLRTQRRKQAKKQTSKASKTTKRANPKSSR